MIKAFFNNGLKFKYYPIKNYPIGNYQEIEKETCGLNQKKKVSKFIFDEQGYKELSIFERMRRLKEKK